MKKFNLSEIMKRAWEIVKRLGVTISVALKESWRIAKEAMNKIKFVGTAKVAKIEKGEVNPYIGTENDSESNYFTFNLWEKGNHKRIYINDYKRRPMGYIDVKNGNELVSDYSGIVEETANYFIQNYEF